MTNPFINPQPSYSGVTIQISNPSVNVGPYGTDVSAGNVRNTGYVNNPLIRSGNYSACPQACYSESGKQTAQIQGGVNGQSTDFPLITDGNGNPIQNNPTPYPNAYPAQYYLNNYNYGVNGNGNNTGDFPSDKVNGYDLKDNNEKSSDISDTVSSNRLNAAYSNNETNKNSDNGIAEYSDNSRTDADNYTNNNNEKEKLNSTDVSEYSIPERNHSMNSYRMYADSEQSKQTDMSTSKEIIADLNDREAKLQEEKKNSKETKIVALTDEYIKSLENYLNNPNDELRLMASKEILTRLDEDKDRYNDAALNALLNKMLQDPSKTVRVAALSAFASQLASGNDYTVKLLRDIQANPNSDKEDVLQAADILLKMSAGVEVKNIPNPQTKENKQ